MVTGFQYIVNFVLLLTALLVRLVSPSSESNNLPLHETINVDMAIEAMAMGRDLLKMSPTTPQLPSYASKYVQTIYRESEAQTDPYTPPYVVNVGQTPEVLTLATLGYGKGLPAGLHDVEMIERARERRKMERSLEPYGEIAHIPRKVAERRRIMQDMELREWHYREREVEALQEIRLKVLVELLRKREVHAQELSEQRLDRLWEERCAKKEARCRAVKLKYITALRKLVRRRLSRRESSSPKRRDVIKEYANPASQSFAPLTRLGIFPDRGSESFMVKNAYVSTYEGLMELENSLAPEVLKPKIKIKPIPMYTKDGFLRRDFRHLQELATLQEYLEGAFKIGSEQARKPRFLERIMKPPPRPVTPTIVPPTGDLTLEKEMSAITLQKLIRGRAIQTQMYEGKEKRLELISELRSTHALLEDEQAEKRRDKLSILNTQQQRADLMHEDNQVDDVLSRFECGSLAEMLDFLSKELNRLIEERRTHALVLLAERHRRMREAEESGTRQHEERRRREQDEIFKQIIKVHQETVDGYLKTVAGLALDTTADHIARCEVDEFAMQIDTAAKELEHQRDPLESDLVAADMVHNFLIPEDFMIIFRDIRSSIIHQIGLSNQEIASKQFQRYSFNSITSEMKEYNAIIKVNRQYHQTVLNARQRKFLQAAHHEIWTPTHNSANVVLEIDPSDNGVRKEHSTMTDDLYPEPQLEQETNGTK